MNRRSVVHRILKWTAMGVLIVALLSMFAELRYVRDSNIIRHMASIQWGGLHYVEWGMPPATGKPKAGQGITLHLGGFLGPHQPYPVGSPANKWQTSFAIPLIVLLVAAWATKPRRRKSPAI